MRFFFSIPSSLFFCFILFSAHFRLIYCEKPREKLGGPGRIIVREKRPAVSLCVSNSTRQTKRDTLFNRKNLHANAPVIYSSQKSGISWRTITKHVTKKKKKIIKLIINNYIFQSVSPFIRDKQHPGINFVLYIHCTCLYRCFLM